MYIEKIKSPADLKKLDLKELQVVADETRQAVLNRVSKHGGHVGPNLGFVEATVALHYVFNDEELKDGDCFWWMLVVSTISIHQTSQELGQ